MDVYVVVTIAGDPRTEQKTPVDKDGGTSPSCNHSMTFTIDEAAAQMNRLNLIFRLRRDRSLLTDKDIGELHVPVKELLENVGDGKPATLVKYPVRTPSGKSKGKLKFSYKFGAVYKVDAHVTTYPVHGHAGTSSMYGPPVAVGPYSPPVTAGPYPSPLLPPPPPAGYPPLATGAGGYGYPTYGGYPPPPPVPAGYPPMASGYGYPPMQQLQQPPKKNKFGLGLGAGVVGGVIGGLLIGDMVSDAGAAYDAGYDAGFDNGVDFDC